MITVSTRKKETKDPKPIRCNDAKQKKIFEAECALLNLLGEHDYPSYLSFRALKRKKNPLRSSAPRKHGAPRPLTEEQEDVKNGENAPRSDSFSTQLRIFSRDRAEKICSITEVIHTLYIAISDNMHICEMLRALGELPKDFGARGESIIIIPAHAVANHEDVREHLEALVDSGAEVIFDENDPKACLRSDPDSIPDYVMRSKLYQMRTKATYVGENVDQELLFTIYRNKFIDEVDRAWGKLVVSGTNVSDPPLRTIEQHMAFARLLTLGNGKFEKMSRKAKSPKWKADALENVDFPLSLAGDDIADVAKELDMFFHMKKAWVESADLVGVRIVIEREDLTRDDEDNDLQKRINFLAECFGVDTLIDAMNQGLPMDDLLCGGLSKFW